MAKWMDYFDPSERPPRSDATKVRAKLNADKRIPSFPPLQRLSGLDYDEAEGMQCSLVIHAQAINMGIQWKQGYIGYADGSVLRIRIVKSAYVSDRTLPFVVLVTTHIL